MCLPFTINSETSDEQMCAKAGVFTMMLMSSVMPSHQPRTFSVSGNANDSTIRSVASARRRSPTDYHDNLVCLYLRDITHHLAEGHCYILVYTFNVLIFIGLVSPIYYFNKLRVFTHTHAHTYRWVINTILHLETGSWNGFIC